MLSAGKDPTSAIIQKYLVAACHPGPMVGSLFIRVSLVTSLASIRVAFGSFNCSYVGAQTPSGRFVAMGPELGCDCLTTGVEEWPHADKAMQAIIPAHANADHRRAIGPMPFLSGSDHEVQTEASEAVTPGRTQPSPVDNPDRNECECISRNPDAER
jgi:hypothetical protein